MKKLTTIFFLHFGWHPQRSLRQPSHQSPIPPAVYANHTSIHCLLVLSEEIPSKIHTGALPAQLLFLDLKFIKSGI